MCKLHLVKLATLPKARCALLPTLASQLPEVREEASTCRHLLGRSRLVKLLIGKVRISQQFTTLPSMPMEEGQPQGHTQR